MLVFLFSYAKDWKNAGFSLNEKIGKMLVSLLTMQ
jgi:hypothetical protein